MGPWCRWRTRSAARDGAKLRAERAPSAATGIPADGQTGRIRSPAHIPRIKPLFGARSASRRGLRRPYIALRRLPSTSFPSENNETRTLCLNTK
jgi:hypothetical protein